MQPNSKLHQHKIGAIQRAITLGGKGQSARPGPFGEDALRDASHHVEAATVDVVQHQLVDRQTIGVCVEALHQLRRVGAAPADHGDLHTHDVGSYGKVQWNC
jgi:hypothetical protein